MRKICVIGAGDRGKGYMQAAKTFKDVEFTAVCDILEDRKESAIKDFGFKMGYDDYKSAITESKPDVVIVATPAYLHCDIAKFAMENGADVLTEKPFDLDLKKCLELKELSQKTGKKLAIGYQYHNVRLHRTMKHMFERGILGDKVMVNYIDLREIRPKIAMHDAVTGNGGPMVDMSCHFFDLMRWFTDAEPVNVYSSWSVQAENRKMLDCVEHKAPDTASIIVNYSNGYTLNVTVGWGLPERVPGEQLLFATGTNGYMKATNFAVQGSVTVMLRGGEEIKVGLEVEEEGELRNASATVMQGLFNEIDGDGKAHSSFDDGIMSVATSMAAIKSGAEGRMVEIAEILKEMPTISKCMGNRYK
jgi:predicted dehydrogenase